MTFILPGRTQLVSFRTLAIQLWQKILEAENVSQFPGLKFSWFLAFLKSLSVSVQCFMLGEKSFKLTAF